LLASKLQTATSNGAFSSANDQETVQGQLNHCILELTEVDFGIENGTKFWSQRIAPLAVDLLLVPAFFQYCRN